MSRCDDEVDQVVDASGPYRVGSVRQSWRMRVFHNQL